MKPLITDRLLLKPLTVEDAQDVYELNSDPEVLKYTGDLPFDDLSAARQFLANYNHYEKWLRGRLGVFRLDNNIFLGWCGLKYHEETGETDLGYRFKKSYWGYGYGTEAARICIRDGFSRLQLKRIYAEAFSANMASIKIMEKTGMTFFKDTFMDGVPGKIYDIKAK